MKTGKNRFSRCESVSLCHDRMIPAAFGNHHPNSSYHVIVSRLNITHWCGNERMLHTRNAAVQSPTGYNFITSLRRAYLVT